MSLRQTLSFVLLALISLLSLASLPTPAQDKYAAAEQKAHSREADRDEAREQRRAEERKHEGRSLPPRVERKSTEEVNEKKAEKSEETKESAWEKKHPIVNGLIWAIILAAIGFYIIGHFMLLCATFRTGVLWGLAFLFIPFVGLIYIIVHWADAKKPVNWMATGIAIGILGAIFSGVIRGAWS